MRIALVASSFLPRIGGVEEHVSLLARELTRRGHDVVVWSVDQGDETPTHDGATPLRYLPTPLPRRSVPALVRWVGAAARAWRTWRRAVREDRPDVLVIQCYGPNGPWATALARRTGIPLVYANHGETFMDADRVFETSAVLRRALRDTLTRAAAVVSCSRFAADDLDRFGPPVDAVVVGNGIDLDLPAAPLAGPLPARYVAGVGRLVPVKGFERLLRAFAEVGARHDDLDLVIGGAGPSLEGLRRRAAELGLADRVHFPGRLSRGQVRTLLDGAVAHVVPSDVEAFGIVVLEGWRSGAPVIATDRGGPPEFLRDGVDGLLFDPDDDAALTARLESVVSDAGFARDLGEAGRRAARDHSWAAVADRYEAVLDAVVTPRDDR